MGRWIELFTRAPLWEKEFPELPALVINRLGRSSYLPEQAYDLTDAQLRALDGFGEVSLHKFRLVLQNRRLRQDPEAVWPTDIPEHRVTEAVYMAMA